MKKPRQEADALIRKYALFGVGCALIPSPVIDMAAVTAVEVQMIRKLAAVYEFKFPRNLVASKITLSVLGSIAPIYVARRFQNSVKIMPVLGFWLSAGLLGIANGACVYAVGKVFQRHFESGGTFLSANNAILRRFFRKSYEEGKVVVSSIASPAHPGGANL